MKKPFFAIAIALVSCAVAFSQNLNNGNAIAYAYDASGNRIARYIVLNAPSQAPRVYIDEEAEETEEPDEQALIPALIEQFTADLQVKIYPNPTKGILLVELAGNGKVENAQITVFNQSGQQILYTGTDGALTTVNLSTFPQGMYVLRLIVGNKATDYKIIKK